MKVYIVTSAVTFVPQNYNHLISVLAKDRRIQGLILIKNKEFSFLLTSLFLIFSGAAPRFGFQLLKNYIWFPIYFKRKIFKDLKRDVFITKDINSRSSLDYLKSQKIDLLINARTRSFFKEELLSVAKLGCVNIHHGLLPDQRGLMCDFWAHLEKTSFGFSIHQMTSKLDDGQILKVVQVKTSGANYLESISESSKLEGLTLIELLNQIEKEQDIRGIENKRTLATIYRRNPRWTDFLKLKKSGVRI